MIKKKLSKSFWIAASFAGSFLLLGLFAPIITNSPPGSATELLTQVNVIVQTARDLDDSSESQREFKQAVFQIRGGLLGINNSYEGKDSSGEILLQQKFQSMVTKLAELDVETQALFKDDVAEFGRLIEARKSSIFPIIKIGPETPLQENAESKQRPGGKYFFGTDRLGRDIFSLVVHGIRNSLFFAILVVFICLVVGVTLGGLMGYYGGWFDLAFQRFVEVIMNFPFFLLQLTILAFMPPHLTEFWRYVVLAGVMCAVGWIPYARYTRAEFFRLRRLDFALAADALGASGPRKFFRHLLPNAMTPNITYIPFDLASTILGLGALSFIGFGEPPGTASLGELLFAAKQDGLRLWWIALFPGFALFFLTLALVLFGGAIRDVTDPRYSASDS